MEAQEEMDIDDITIEVERTRQRNRNRARQRREQMSPEERADHLRRRRETQHQQRQRNESDASRQASIEQRREINRIRSRERRETRTPEEHEAHLARRRYMYHLRRGNISVQGFGNASETPSSSTQASNTQGQLARSIPIPINTSSTNNHSERENQRFQRANVTANSNTNQRTVRLARSMPIPVLASSNHSNHSTISTSGAQTSGRVSNRITTNVSLCPIPVPSFSSIPANQFEASTSHARPSITEDPNDNEDNLLSSSPDHLDDPPDVDRTTNQNTTRSNPLHNCARNCYTARQIRRLQLPLPRICSHCRAKLFRRETRNFCCKGGRVILPEIPVPVELMNLFTDQSAEGRLFRQNIRAYNHVFSFTSMGVSLDENLVPFNQGIYTFRAHGVIYHRIGSLLPLPGIRPRYIQLFIYDTEHELENRLQENGGLDKEVIEKIKCVLDAHNPFVTTLRQLAQRPDIGDCSLLIRERPAPNLQYALPTASQVAAILVGGEESMDTNHRDIVVQTITGQLLNIKEYTGYYDPLQYPLFLPYGTYGWDSDFQSIQGSRITCCDYYAYMFQIRGTIPSILLHGGRLLQQYVVDNYVKIETQRLRWIRFHQNNIRAELYEGLQDCLDAGETDAGNVGRRTILPSSFVGSPRDMYQRYQDAMAIVQKFGKPDIFLTMTCNPSWEEIKRELLPGQTAQDRPDLLTRIFRAKCEELKEDIFHRGVLGKAIAHVHVIEFQKRGLPHVHMLVIFDEDDKLNSPDDYDRIVRAEIPKSDEEPELYAAVLKHMIHGPCGHIKPNAPCMKNGSCKKGYPKQFAEYTRQGNDSYPVYQRRNDNRSIALDTDGEVVIDNGWVVPYNPWLLLKYDCHINVEVCSSIKSVKYLYKYVYKGPDCVVFEVRPGPNYDEVSQYVDGRWICAPEAFWRIFKFPMSKIYPSVERLQIHLPNRQQVRFYSHQSISDVLDDKRNSRTMLTEFFRIYNDGQEPNQYLYSEFPKYYRWLASQRIWVKRRTTQKVIGRVYAVSPNEGERFYLRLLLNHVRGPRSFDDLLTVDGVHYLTFKQAAEKRGLLQEDNSIRECLIEAQNFRMPSALRRLFATILLYCEPSGVRRLWDENFSYMIEDYPSSSSTNQIYILNKLLHDLNGILMQHKRGINEFDLPRITEGFEDLGTVTSLIEQELSLPISDSDLNSLRFLNECQFSAFDVISQAIRRKQSAIFFVDGPGGTGKTFLYKALLAYFRKDGFIILATATSGIAANLLPGGRTAHSKLKIPIKFEPFSLCLFSKQSELSTLIECASAIIWDEAPMAHRKAFETVDRTFRDMLGVDLPFGGKVMILGGDFCQVLPVVIAGTKSQIINASIVQSPLWRNVKLLHLSENMRAQNDLNFSEFLLCIGNGVEPTIEDGMIRIPNSMSIPWEGEHSIEQLIDFVFPELSSHTYDSEYMASRALITPLNDDVNKLNEKVLNIFHGDDVTYYSFDSVADDVRNLYLPEFLNSLSPGSLPPHKLTLKKGAPVMLLRNIDPKIGLCNGTRLICHRFGRNIIEAKILAGQFKGMRVFLPRIPLKTAEDANMPFEMTRRQFPIRLSFALTINKSQGQTIPNVGIYLRNHVFSHGQLYVALSRGVSEKTTKVLVRKGSIDGHEGVFTKNVVYKEIFEKLRTTLTNSR